MKQKNSTSEAFSKVEFFIEGDGGIFPAIHVFRAFRAIAGLAQIHTMFMRNPG